MNYLAHYVFNHDVCRLAETPAFVMGVALPDLWSRFSRKRRLHWRAVRAATPENAESRHLRDGLLNHAEVDRRFHVAPSFHTWRSELKRTADGDGTHPMVVDFTAHAITEMVLDQLLLAETPALADRFYDALAPAEPLATAVRAGRLGDVDTEGLETTIDLFQRRRFLRSYADDEGVLYAIGLILQSANLRQPPPEAMLRDMHARALRIVEPSTVWRDLAR